MNDYSMSSHDADELKGVVLLPFDIRRRAIKKYVEEHGKEVRSFRLTDDHVIAKCYKSRAPHNIVRACMKCNGERSVLTAIASLVRRKHFEQHPITDRLSHKLRRILTKFKPLIESKLLGDKKDCCRREIEIIEGLLT